MSEGVLHALWVTRIGGPRQSRLLEEAVEAATALKKLLHGGVPIALSANAYARLHMRGSLHLWDEHHNLSLSPSLHSLVPWYKAKEDDGSSTVRRPNMYIFKLSALMHSPFERTLFLDVDVRVLRPAMVHHVLRRLLLHEGVHYAAPISENGWGLGSAGPTRHALTNASSETPLLCSCVVGFTRNETAHIFAAASRALMNGPHPGAGSRAGVARHTDQEYLWFELRSLFLNHRERVRVLGVEWYCPPLTHPRLKQAADGTVLNASIHLIGIPRHPFAFGPEAACWAVHGHAYNEMNSSMYTKFRAGTNSSGGTGGATPGGTGMAEWGKATSRQV